MHTVHSEAPQYAPLPRLLSVPEVAGSLRVSSRYVWQLVSRGKIPSIRIGRRVLVSRQTLDSIVANGLP